MKAAISKIVIVALEYNIDLSRLEVVALDKSNKINELNSILRIERFELPFYTIPLFG